MSLSHFRVQRRSIVPFLQPQGSCWSRLYVRAPWMVCLLPWAVATPNQTRPAFLMELHRWKRIGPDPDRLRKVCQGSYELCRAGCRPSRLMWPKVHLADDAEGQVRSDRTSWITWPKPPPMAARVHFPAAPLSESSKSECLCRSVQPDSHPSIR